MSYLRSYKHLNQLIQNESFEPLISWGLRMAISGTLPVIWGLATGRMNDAIWITLTAEAISWVEMKGSFTWRVRTLTLAATISVLFSALGSVTGGNIWLSVACMFFVGFVATLLKSIGDRASGLAICMYLLFIICNAYPATLYTDVHHRLVLVTIGAMWPVVVGVFVSLLMPAEEPFRRQIALIWRAIAELVDTVSKTASGRHDDVYQKERDVRTAIDNSYQFYGRMAHQVQTKDNREYQLAQLRKAASLVAVNAIAMGEEMENINISELDDALRIKAGTLFNVLNEAITRISVFVITLKPEERLLAVAHINRLKKFKDLIGLYPLPADAEQASAIGRILKLTDRTAKLLESAIQRIDLMGKDVPVYRSYSFIKTLFLLRPKYLARNVRFLFNFNTLTSRYALRSAIAACVGLFIYKWFHIDHGYWLPFSVMIVIQPYFGATLKKALDRIAGTVLGGLTGSLLLYLPVGLHIKEIILFLTFILMVYYLRKNYAIAAFTITLNLVLLFNIESAYSNLILIERAVCTVGGAMLAVISGFALFPTWDKKWLPAHLAAAIGCNYKYFTETFLSTEGIANWTRQKRLAESKNSDVFDSFNRYMSEPGKQKTEVYYGVITTNVRITRNLNNIHLEQDEKKALANIPGSASPLKRISEAHELFNKIAGYLPLIDAGQKVELLELNGQLPTSFALNEAQVISLEKLTIELKTMLQDIEALVKE